MANRFLSDEEILRLSRDTMLILIGPSVRNTDALTDAQLREIMRTIPVRFTLNEDN
jgi:hypothetical protein